MTVQQITYECLSYIGEYSLTLTEYSGPSSDAVFRGILTSINQALDELFQLNPQLFKRKVGLTVAAPVIGTVTTISGSALVTTALTPLVGNSIKIAGQTEWNAIGLDGSDKRLLFPYTGTSGTQTATLYGDGILLPSTYSRPLGPVWLADLCELTPLAGQSDLLGYDAQQDYNTDWGLFPANHPRFPRGRTIAQPEAFLVDTHLLSDGTAQTRIFLTPVPDKAYSLAFEAGVRPLPALLADIGIGVSDPGRVFGVPAGLDYRFLLPLVLNHWSKKSFFENEKKARKLEQDYVNVLPEIEGWKVQPQTGGHMTSSGWKRK